MVKDIYRIETSVKFHHTPLRRDGGDGIEREVDYLINLFNCYLKLP